jgi:siderophore synthetase component
MNHSDNLISQDFQTGIRHLKKDVWNLANRKHITKVFAEFLHECLIDPVQIKTETALVHFRLATDSPAVYYTFSGEYRAMDYWHLDPNSVVKHVDGKIQPALDVIQFFLDMKETLGVKPLTLSKFIEETYNTLYADAYILAQGRIGAHLLVDAPYTIIEHQMDGHPWATVNKGRIGFSYEDYLDFVPEANKMTTLFWLGVHKSKASYAHTKEYNYERLVQEELGIDLQEEFNAVLFSHDVNPEEYLFLPVHEWQWKHKLTFLFAGDIANQYIIPLGKGNDSYTPQQSIRTFFNTDKPEKLYVKTAISILNTSVYRGLSPAKLSVAPFVTTWVKNKLDTDPVLKRLGFTLLGEVATIGYKHNHYEQVENGPYHYKELLGAIWRESATNYLNEGERIMTMASLLYVDENGKSFTAELIRKSGLTPEAWLKVYLKSYLTPILHIFYQHKFFFSPHGENTILVIQDYVPVRIIIKDFVEEIVLTQDGRNEAPEEAKNILRDIDDEYATLFILSGVFDGVFRYLSNVFQSYVGLDEKIFWQHVAQVIDGYQKDHPEFKERYEKFDLFIPEFIRVCINRVRLLTYGYSEEASIPVPEICGTLINPAAINRKK